VTKVAVSKNIPACDRQIEKQTGHIARLHELFNFMGFVVSKKITEMPHNTIFWDKRFAVCLITQIDPVEHA